MKTVVSDEVELLKKQIKKLKQTVNKYKYDYLTGFKMRIDYEEAIIRAEYDINNNDSEYTFIIIDLDGLHNINRIHGYEYGDNVIKKLSIMLGDMFCPSDIYRIGGDEFMIISKKSIDIDKIKMLDKISVKVTYCYGFVRRVEDRININDIIKVLDSCLIEKKSILRRRKNDR